VTAQGHPRTIFTRAIENGNLVVAEMTSVSQAELARGRRGHHEAVAALKAMAARASGKGVRSRHPSRR
jgi:hypothetical protein